MQINDRGETCNEKLISWNVNGLRACVGKGFLDIFKELDADIFCIQESKLQEARLIWSWMDITSTGAMPRRKDIQGLRFLQKEEPLSVTYGLGIEAHDHEGRVITAEFPDYYVITCYTPNSQDGWQDCLTGCSGRMISSPI